MSETIALQSLDKLDIHSGNTRYHGGDQEWYPEFWQRQAGCGPTSCTNILWYLARTRGICRPLCTWDASRKSGFIRLMEEVWRYVTPGNMGVNTTDIFKDGAERFGRDKDVPLRAEAYNVSGLAGGRRDYAALSAFVAESLSQDLPVAFLNLSNGTLRNLDSWHWVTIVSLRGEEALIFDQGRARWIGLRQWLGSSLMGGGLVRVEVRPT